MCTIPSMRSSLLLGRALLTLAVVPLLGAWLLELTGGTILGMDQQHLFNDVTALSLLGIGSLLHALIQKDRP